MVRYMRLKACDVFPQRPVDHLSQKKTDTDIIKQLKRCSRTPGNPSKKEAKGKMHWRQEIASSNRLLGRIA
jgi:hypothetical protein